MSKDPDGLFYSAMDPNGMCRIGWVCRSDFPSYDDIAVWHDALDELASSSGLHLLMLRRCTQSEAMEIAKQVTESFQ